MSRSLQCSRSPKFCPLRATVVLGMLILGMLCVPLDAAEDHVPALQARLNAGDLAGAQALLDSILAGDPNQAQARFGSGLVQVLSAIERLGQDQYRYGALTEVARTVPVFRLPLPVNPDPQEVSYAQIRDLIAEFQGRLLKAESELARVALTPDLKLTLDFSAVRLDLTGDGRIEEGESLMALLGTVNRRGSTAPPVFKVALDAGDVPWLRGYCHFLCAFCDMVLAYDHQRLFDHCGQLIYPRPVPSAAAAARLDTAKRRSDAMFRDLIAAIHLISFPVREPDRARSAREHLLAMLRTSRESWSLILEETDNDQEWLPNPSQTGILQIPVTAEMINSWQDVLTEMEDLLEGRKLVPFWRDYIAVLEPTAPIAATGRGINLRKFFDEPRDFDLILTIQGSGVLPYLESGPLSTPGTWNSLTRVFRGEFFGFVVWFN